LKEAGVTTHGLDTVFVSVGKIEEAFAFYRDIGGLKVVADERLDPGIVERFWGVAPGTGAHAVFFKMEEQSTLIGAVEFNPNTGKPIRPDAAASFYGIHDIAFRVTDMDAIYRDMFRKGYRFLTPPVKYQPAFTPFAVKQVFFLGPGDAPHTLIERMQGTADKPSFVGMPDSAQFVEDHEQAVHFYHDLLELDSVQMVEACQSVPPEMMGIAPGSFFRIAFLNQTGTLAAPTEVIRQSRKLAYPAIPARPPNLGLFMLLYQVDSLEPLLKRMAEEKFALLSGPLEMRSAAHGRVRAAVVEGPARVMVGLFER
jgi:catechol 2,3-dioxygenase-like lactoylglutathione lyase family enzyme